MSFIYAKKFSDTIAIFSDTKISNDDKRKDNIDRFIKSFDNQEEAHNIIKYGILKCYIITPHCALAFAGNDIKIANNLLGELSTSNSIEEIKQLCYKRHIHSYNHKKQDFDIDFILAYYQDNNCYLLSIKEGKMQDVQNEHLGSNIAFSEFQRRGENNNPLEMIEINAGIWDWFASIETIRSYDKLFERFYNSVFSSADDTVGGFVIPLVFNNKTKRFEFRSYIKNIQTGTYNMNPIKGNDVILLAKQFLSQDKSKGDFSVYFYGTNDNQVIVYVAENSDAITFARDRLNIEKANKDFINFSVPNATKKNINELGFDIKKIVTTSVSFKLR